MSDQSQHNPTTAVISPADLLEEKPAHVDEGYYLARLADDGVGNPSYAVLPLQNGVSAEHIALGSGGTVYARTRIQEDEVLYRVRGEDSASAWSARD